MIKKIEVYILAILFIFAFYCSLTIGSSWDELYEMTIGKDRLKYLFTFGSYKNFNFHIFTEFYPGFYNTFAILITKLFPSKFEIEVWHIVNTTFSILTVFGISKITSNLFNKTVGKIVFIICFTYPIFFGHMAINSKDTIIAFANIWSTYIFLRYIQKQNANPNRYILLSGLTIGLGTGVRLPFLVTLFPLLIFIIIDIFLLKKIINTKFSSKKFFLDLIKILTIAYLISIAFWPQAHLNIFFEPFRLFLEHIKHGGGGVPWILFNGQFFNTSELPSNYILINLLFKSPEFLLLSYLIFIFVLIFNNKFFIKKFSLFWTKISLIIFILLFPFIYFVFLPVKIYDGIRLFLFIIPYFCIIPGLAIYYLITHVKRKIILPISIIVSILFVYFLYNFITITPYHYTYLNRFNGNFSLADKKFENDYWAVSTKELINKIKKQKDFISKNKKIKLALCGVNHEIVMKELDKIKNFNYEIKHLFSNDFDYVIMTNRSQLDENDSTITNIKTCYQIVKGTDLFTVKRKGLILSTFREKF